MRWQISLFILGLLLSSLPAQTPEQKKATIKFLQDLQVSDGGFVPAPVDGRVDQNPRGSVRATSGAVRALKYFGGEPKDKKAAAKFVQGCWDAQTGSFSDAPGGKGDVFTTAVGLPLQPSNVTHNFQKTLERLGLRRQRFHDLRHCCASLMLAQGLTLKDVMETLGHSQISLSANLYGHLYADRRREVASRMDGVLGAGRS